MIGFRTDEGDRRYRAALAAGILDRGCPLCILPSIKEFTHWRIIKNEYPYDAVAAVHDMIVLKRHIAEGEFIEAEKQELLEIKNSHLNQEYEYIIEAIGKYKSIPAHFHLHLIVPKK